MLNPVLHQPSDTGPLLSEDQANALLLQNIQDGYILADRQLSIVCFNKAAKENIFRLLGIDIYPGLSVMELVSQERKQILADIFVEVLRGNTHSTENSFVRADSGRIFFENIFTPAFDTEGNVAGIVLSSKNITAIKNAQEAILKSEERLQFALEAANQGAWDWDLQTNEVTYSSSYKKLYGFAENELKDHVSEWITRIHPDDQKKMRDSINDHIQSGKPEYDSQYRIRAKDGRYRWVMAKGRLVTVDEEGRPLRMIGTHTDITANVEREIALKQMNERFDTVMMATHELLWEWDLVRDRISRSRQGLKKVLGVQDDKNLISKSDSLNRIHPDDRREVENAFNNVMRAPHQHTFEMEYRFLRDDGEYAHVYDRGILLKDERNKPVRIIGSAQDISERKRLEKELLQKELTYQRAIHQATVDSQERERAEIGKELHDNINQVLTTTKLYLDLALTNAELGDELIKKSLQNINGIIQEIRQLSRSLMDPSIGDLGLVASLKDLVENVHHTQKLKIDFTAGSEIDSLLGPGQKLAVYRIVQEALNNVLCHAKATKVLLTLFAEGKQMHLILKDDGIGFQPETLRRGAGLKNIKNRIYLIHGTLQLDSQPAKGCTLRLQFPLETTTENEEHNGQNHHPDS